MLVCKIKKKLKGFSLDVDFTADANVTALMGASGSGKSMTLRCIAGISKPDEGRIELNGKVLFDSEKKINLPPQKRNTGFLFQDYALFPNMTVLQNIMCGAVHILRDKRKSAAEEIAENFRITKHLNKYPHELSGGEKQRCALARILIGSPDILMLDEPFASLDSHLRWELEMEMASVFKNNFSGMPVLYVSHNRDEVYRLCNNVMIINKGKIEPMIDKWQLFKNPETIHAARLTGCKNIAPAIADGKRITVPDWGIEFETDKMQKEIRYAGIRANNIVHVSNVKPSEKAVIVPYEIVSEIEDAFMSILMVRKRGTQLSPIRWEMPKKKRDAIKELPQELAVLQENMLLLK